MKRYAIATAVLVLTVVSVAAAQRSREQPVAETQSVEGILAEISIGQAVMWPNPHYSSNDFTVLALPAGETPSKYRERLKQAVEELEKDIAAAKAEAKEHWSARPEVRGDEEVSDEKAKKLKEWTTKICRTQKDN